jgi:hypothetical protein
MNAVTNKMGFNSDKLRCLAIVLLVVAVVLVAFSASPIAIST